MEEEALPDEAREAALALENAGLDRGLGPQPDERGYVVNAPDDAAGTAEGEANANDGNDEAQEEEPHEELPPGVPVVEDEDN